MNHCNYYYSVDNDPFLSQSIMLVVLKKSKKKKKKFVHNNMIWSKQVKLISALFRAQWSYFTVETLQRLDYYVGFTGTPIKWFKSYLVDGF